MLKLGTPVSDSATKLKGMLTHMQVNGAGSSFYNFQPRGLNPKDGQPLRKRWITPDRVEGGIEIPDRDLPINILGTEVEDMASGFKGTAISLTLHINGCVHVSVQPSGRQPETGEPIEDCDFDIRLLKGKAIKPIDEEEKSKNRAEKPGPAAFDRCAPKPV